MKFICTKIMGLDGSVIYPGVYDVENDKDFGYIVKGAQGYNGSVNLLADKEDLLECGYFDNM